MLLRIYDHIREFCFIKVYYRKFEHCQYYVQCVGSQKDTVLKKLFVTFPKEQFRNIIIFLQVISLSGRNIQTLPNYCTYVYRIPQMYCTVYKHTVQVTTYAQFNKIPIERAECFLDSRLNYPYCEKYPLRSGILHKRVQRWYKLSPISFWSLRRCSSFSRDL